MRYVSLLSLQEFNSHKKKKKRFIQNVEFLTRHGRPSIDLIKSKVLILLRAD